MKHYEELSRIRVEEAIQAGLRSQAAHRALSEHKPATPPASLKKARMHDSMESSQHPWFVLLMSKIFNVAR
jgi:hypothetical protein